MSLYDSVSSPTVNLVTVYIILAVAAFEDLTVSCVDIKGAYLNANLKTIRVHMRIPSSLAVYLVQVYKDLFDQDISEYQESDGSIIVELKKALYGLVESAKLWYEHLKDSLCNIGYRVSQHDQGLFFKANELDKSFVCIHVDDILIATNSARLQTELLNYLKKTYKEINVQTGNQIFYLGSSSLNPAM